MSARKLYKKILEENKRLEEENESLISDIRMLVQNDFSSDRVYLKLKWRKYFEKEETFKKLWKEIQPRKDRGNQST
ncbi:hypothetical protein LV716_01195 [Flagellimonas sp. HMM57]|uniref:hypothetical protein n=1 Tax=unclassified Flagellimonas TaxID=2644544 RepID=UPI0013CFECA9|nr:MULTISPECIES: hypothetical protein [unclassified Flagellimonas]UII76429.1 hypothetical protein LV716_01195 [Flagellimonas sp. HMM57]